MGGIRFANGAARLRAARLRHDEVEAFNKIMDDKIIFFDAVGNASVFPAGVR